ncbi:MULTISPECIES: RHS repeat-associated core domain-containing protein [unclassified Pseudomonas]|uniref:RHS repeat-associated core domain-containing protein n=1 Tax=unclassified Pseudomonas TaxID=196821 RepID=UPI003917D0DB
MPRDKTDRTTLPHQSNCRSAISATSDKRNLVAYTAYGFSAPQQGLASSLGFNGERLNLPAAGYLLGNGYRLYNPQLMRFLTNDNLSPFGRGGLNAYAYCAGDPVNKIDPSGHAPLIFRPVVKFYRWLSKKMNTSSTRSDSSYYGGSGGSVGSVSSIPPASLAASRNSHSSVDSFGSNSWYSWGDSDSSSGRSQWSNIEDYIIKHARDSRLTRTRTMEANIGASYLIDINQTRQSNYQTWYRDMIPSTTRFRDNAISIGSSMQYVRDTRRRFPNHLNARDFPVSYGFD